MDFPYVGFPFLGTCPPPRAFGTFANSSAIRLLATRMVFSA
jgi:hypothetical protein